jgi:hypothetical protein
MPVTPYVATYAKAFGKRGFGGFIYSRGRYLIYRRLNRRPVSWCLSVWAFLFPSIFKGFKNLVGIAETGHMGHIGYVQRNAPDHEKR